MIVASTTPNRVSVASCTNCDDAGVSYISMAHYKMDADGTPPATGDDSYSKACTIGSTNPSVHAGRVVVHP